MADQREAPVGWDQLLVDAIEQPGNITTAYSNFHNYSLGNQMLALWQCQLRGLPPGPLGAFKHWIKVKRCVRKGERALVLCQPVPMSGWRHGVDKDYHPYAEEVEYVRFMYQARWFVLAQTDGEPYVAPPIPGWDAATALASLKIAEEAFDELNGNVMGYTSGRTIHVSPLSPWPHKTRFHEMAHVLLHTGKDTDDGATALLERPDREVEAEAVAYLCCATLELPGMDVSRNYLQHYIQAGGREVIPGPMARRIFATAERILRAGRPKAIKEESDAA